MCICVLCLSWHCYVFQACNWIIYNPDLDRCCIRHRWCGRKHKINSGPDGVTGAYRKSAVAPEAVPDEPSLTEFTNYKGDDFWGILALLVFFIPHNTVESSLNFSENLTIYKHYCVCMYCIIICVVGIIKKENLSENLHVSKAKDPVW